MTNCISSCTLEGRCVLLVPLTPRHSEDLRDAVADGELYHIWHEDIPRPNELNTDIARRLTRQAQGETLAFTVRERSSLRTLGTTNYVNIDLENKRVGIGETWLRASSQRTGVNIECKLLLLHHAFEALDCTVVNFHVCTLNHTARTSLDRLGASLDGILRSHKLSQTSGLPLDMAVYSITASEWPTIRSHLEWRLRGRH